MARSEARLKRRIWTGLRGTSPHAKLLYTVLLTEATLNHAGVCAERFDLWAEQAELSAEETQQAFVELVDGRFVYADSLTREVLVRTLIRNDDVPDQPYLFKGALKEALLTESPELRRVLAAELRKLPPQKPDGVSKKTGLKIVYPDPHGAADVLDPPPSANPQKGLETLSEGSQDPVETHLPKKGLDTHSKGNGVGEGVGEGVKGSVGTSSSSVAAPPRGTRVPEDFTVTPDMVTWVRDRCPDVDGKLETERFINHFLAKAGREAIKVDWLRTWRNWMLEEQKRAGTRRPSHLRAVSGRPYPPPGYDADGNQLRDPKSGVLMER